MADELGEYIAEGKPHIPVSTENLIKKRITFMYEKLKKKTIVFGGFCFQVARKYYPVITNTGYGLQFC